MNKADIQCQLRTYSEYTIHMVPKILQYAVSRVSAHQSAALNYVHGEYHHVMYCIQAED